MNKGVVVPDYWLKAPRFETVIYVVIGLLACGAAVSEVLSVAMGPSEEVVAERRAAQEEYAAREALDLTEGFTRIDGGSTNVVVYRDNKTGCEWVSLNGGGLKERTAPDAQGVSRHICQARSTDLLPATPSE